MPRPKPRSPLAPSGRQLDIAHGEQRVSIVEVGGGIRSYTVGGKDVLDGYRIDEMCSGGRGQLLMPWPNRIADGAYEFDGQHHQLGLTEPAAGNAIHGLVRWAAWSVVEHGPDHVAMEHRLHPQPGYPFSLELRVEYRLGDDGLLVVTTATNIGTSRCPFGSGAHPYLRVGDTRVDDLFLSLPGRTALRADDRGIPLGRYPTEGTPRDFRSARAIAALKLDDAYTDLERDADGRAWVRLAEQGSGQGIALWVDEAYPFVMAFSGDTLPDGGRRSLALEPMTCAPNAFVSSDGLLVLEAGASFEGAWGIVPGSAS